LIGFDSNTKLGKELMEWSLRYKQISDRDTHIDPDILIEMKFPPDYPISSLNPSFRIVHPRFVDVDIDLSPCSHEITAENDIDRIHAHSSLSSNSGYGEMMTSSIVDSADSSPLPNRSVSLASLLDQVKSKWNCTTTIFDIAQHLRQILFDCDIHVDMESGLEGYSIPTLGKFWRSFMSVSAMECHRTDLENGGKILLPQSVLEELTQYDQERTMTFVPENVPSVMIFELSTDRARRSYAGVEEFTAPEGQICVPQWMLSNLNAVSGNLLHVRRVSLPRGTFVRLQPHTSDFLLLNDTKAMLEWVLPKFVALTVGDTIVIPYRDKKYIFNVLELRPAKAVYIIDSEMNAEFAPPLSGETIPKTTENLQFNSSSSVCEGNGNSIGIFNRSSDQIEGIDYRFCNNCNHRVPVSAFSMHSVSCVRMNWFCSLCQIVVQRSTKEQHLKEEHAKVACQCGSTMEKRFLGEHKAKQCSLREVTCSFCPLQMPYEEKYEHEAKCGSLTILCDLCSSYVRKQDLAVHSVNCGKPREFDNFFSSKRHRKSEISLPQADKDVLLCPVCSDPFTLLDDLQVHMISNHENAMSDSSQDQINENPQQSQQEENSSTQQQMEQTSNHMKLSSDVDQK